MQQTQLEDLKRLQINLGKLLDDPHPGLSTWQEFLGEVLDDIAYYSPNYIKNMERRNDE